MANQILNPVYTGRGRIFINPDGIGGGSKFVYHNNMKIDGIDRSLGDVESIFLPNPNRYDSFIEVGSIKGSEGRLTSSLSGKLPVDTYSPLEQLADTSCIFNLQVHYGNCARPDDFLNYDSAIILKNVQLTSYNLSALVAINPGERALVDETASISAESMYRIFNQTFINPKPQSSGRVLRVTNMEEQNCSKSCRNFRNGNDIWVALVDATTNDFSVSTDGGATWLQFTTGASQNHTATYQDAILKVAGSYIFWTVTTTAHTTYLYAGNAESVKQSTTPVAIQLDLKTTFIPRDSVVTDSYIYIVGTDETGFGGGEVWRVDKSTLEVRTVFTLSDGIWSISALNDDNVIIGTSIGEIYKSEISGFFTLNGAVAGSSDPIKHLYMHNELHWSATIDVDVYSSNDAGITWKTTFSVISSVTAENAYISWYDNIVGYMVFGSLIFRTIDSGTTWKQIYSGLLGEESLNIQVSPNNPNVFMAAYAINSSSSQIVKGFV